MIYGYLNFTTAEASSNLARFDGVKYGYRSQDTDLELTEFYKQTRSEGFGPEGESGRVGEPEARTDGT